MKPIRNMVTFALACGLQLGMGNLWAQDGLVTGSAGTVTYASGGVGTEQREALASMRGDFNLRMTFATRGSGEMRADVTLTITDRQKNTVMTLENAGPQVFVKLPPGNYWVNARANDQDQARNVTIGRNGAARELYFYWQPNPDQVTVQ